MVQEQARITSRGQVAVPRDIRRALGVRPGDLATVPESTSGLCGRRALLKSIAASEIREFLLDERRFADWVRELRGQ